MKARNDILLISHRIYRKMAAVTKDQTKEETKETKDQTKELREQKEEEMTWLKSTSKHIYFVSETDVRTGETKEIGYCRTRPEADHLIYDWGMKKLKEHIKYREEKKRYNVSYSYAVDNESTRFEIRERSLGYIYDGSRVTRFIVKFTKLYRSYNSLLTPSELENMKKTNEEKD